MEGTETISEEEEQKIREEISGEIFDGKAPLIAAEPEEKEPETQPNDDVSEPEEEEPAAGSDPAMLEILNGINSKLSSLDDVELRLKQTERRIGSIQNDFHNANEAAKKVDAAPSEEEIAAATKTEEAWDGLKEDFPEWADAIDSRLAAKSAEITKQLPDVTGLREGLESVQGSMVTNQALEKRLVGMMHPGWEKTIKTKEYTDWLASQPEGIQRQAAYGETAEEAIDVLSQFKSSKGKKTQEEIALAKKKRLESAVTPETKKKTRLPKSEADMSEQEFRRNEAKKIWGD